MAERDDGGPAFPSDPYIDHPAHGRIHKAQVGDQPYDGMSLRDYFAAQIAGHVIAQALFLPEKATPETVVQIVRGIWGAADVLLHERSK